MAVKQAKSFNITKIARYDNLIRWTQNCKMQLHNLVWKIWRYLKSDVQTNNMLWYTGHFPDHKLASGYLSDTKKLCPSLSIVYMFESFFTLRMCTNWNNSTLLTKFIYYFMVQFIILAFFHMWTQWIIRIKYTYTF